MRAWHCSVPVVVAVRDTFKLLAKEQLRAAAVLAGLFMTAHEARPTGNRNAPIATE